MIPLAKLLEFWESTDVVLCPASSVLGQTHKAYWIFSQQRMLGDEPWSDRHLGGIDVVRKAASGRIVGNPGFPCSSAKTSVVRTWSILGDDGFQLPHLQLSGSRQLKFEAICTIASTPGALKNTVSELKLAKVNYCSPTPNYTEAQLALALSVSFLTHLNSAPWG